MSASNDRLAVIDEFGVHQMWVDDARARELVRAREVRVIRRKGCARVLQVVAGWQKPGRVDPLGRGTALDRTRYSHHRETEDNPPNVWTLVRQAHHTPFVRVLADCMA